MAIHLMCILNNGGLPIFQKQKGTCENMPFSTVASLNGVYVFFQSLDISLKTTSTGEWILVWVDFESITVILCGRRTTEINLMNIAELIFYSFKLFIRSLDFERPDLLDRMKREAKNYMPIVESILESYEENILGYSDCVMTEQNYNIFIKLSEFSSQCGTLFCAFSVNLKLVVATEGWWDLHVTERKLLLIMLCSSQNSFRDTAIYLPNKNPNMAYRFVTIPVSNYASLCVICGLEPSSDRIRNLAHCIFKNNKGIERTVSRKTLDKNFNANVLGFLLLNEETKKYVLSQDLQLLIPICGSTEARLSIVLRRFFNQTDSSFKNCFFDKDKLSITDLGQYWCSEDYKGYTFSQGESKIFVFFTASIPTFNMRKLARKTLTKILRENTVGW